jgi:hypothetical protein
MVNRLTKWEIWKEKERYRSKTGQKGLQRLTHDRRNLNITRHCVLQTSTIVL